MRIWKLLSIARNSRIGKKEGWELVGSFEHSITKVGFGKWQFICTIINSIIFISEHRTNQAFCCGIT